jgi:hypothetical protein
VNRLTQLSVRFASAVPHPEPALPDQVKTQTDKALGALLALAIICLVGAIIGGAFMVFGSESRGHGTKAAALKEHMGVVVAGCIMVACASSIVAFFIN